MELKFRYCEKAKIFEEISHLFLELPKQSERFFQIFVAFSEYLNIKSDRIVYLLQP